MNRLVPSRVESPLGLWDLSPKTTRARRMRIRGVAIMAALVFGGFLVTDSWLGGAASADQWVHLAANGAGLALVLVLAAATFFQRAGDGLLITWALVTEVLVAWVISLEAAWSAALVHTPPPSLTWVVPMIIMVPLVIPVSPGQALSAGILAAVAAPLSLVVLSLAGAAAFPASAWVRVSVSPLFGVLLSMAGARILHGARRTSEAARELGSYQLETPLAEGGMGEVWRARHQFLARPAAIKLIRPEILLRDYAEEAEVVKRRFVDEANVTASLRSPHTVELYDFGFSNEGAFYYAMELLEGMNLEHFIYYHGPLPPARAVHWLAQICHSLGEAHARSLVHRDLKPANVLVCTYGNDVDFIKVLDFGLVKPARQMRDLTKPQLVMGSAGFMAPEQAADRPAHPTMDVYALGCVAYWLLAGKKPFEAESSIELLQMHARDPAPPLRGRTPGPVPEALEQIVLQCLEKDPARRPQQAGALAARFLDSVDEPWTVENARDWWDHVAETAP